MTCIAADHDIGQALSYHHQCAIFFRDTKNFNVHCLTSKQHDNMGIQKRFQNKESRWH